MSWCHLCCWKSRSFSKPHLIMAAIAKTQMVPAGTWYVSMNTSGSRACRIVTGTGGCILQVSIYYFTWYKILPQWQLEYSITDIVIFWDILHSAVFFRITICNIMYSFDVCNGYIETTCNCTQVHFKWLVHVLTHTWKLLVLENSSTFEKYLDVLKWF